MPPPQPNSPGFCGDHRQPEETPRRAGRECPRPGPDRPWDSCDRHTPGTSPQAFQPSHPRVSFLVSETAGELKETTYVRTLSNVLEMLPIIHRTDSAFARVSSPRPREELAAEPRDRSVTPEPQFFPGLCAVPCSHTARAFQCSCAYTSVPDCLCSRVCLCVFMCVRAQQEL